MPATTSDVITNQPSLGEVSKEPIFEKEDAKKEPPKTCGCTSNGLKVAIGSSFLGAMGTLATGLGLYGVSFATENAAAVYTLGSVGLGCGGLSLVSGTACAVNVALLARNRAKES
jgi:hypothetical protein